jgi:hypothetical protein
MARSGSVQHGYPTLMAGLHTLYGTTIAPVKQRYISLTKPPMPRIWGGRNQDPRGLPIMTHIACVKRASQAQTQALDRPR